MQMTDAEWLEANWDELSREQLEECAECIRNGRPLWLRQVLDAEREEVLRRYNYDLQPKPSEGLLPPLRRMTPEIAAHLAFRDIDGGAQ